MKAKTQNINFGEMFYSNTNSFYDVFLILAQMNRPRTALAINYGNYRKTCDIGHLLHAESQIMHLALVWRVWLSYTQNSVGISAKSWPSTVNKLSYPPRLCLQLSMSSMNAWSTALIQQTLSDATRHSEWVALYSDKCSTFVDVCSFSSLYVSGVIATSSQQAESIVANRQSNRRRR